MIVTYFRTKLQIEKTYSNIHCVTWYTSNKYLFLTQSKKDSESLLNITHVIYVGPKAKMSLV